MSDIQKGDIPIGFAFSMAQDMEAMSTFSRMNELEQRSLMRYIEEAPPGEGKSRIEDVVHKLHNHMI